MPLLHPSQATLLIRKSGQDTKTPALHSSRASSAMSDMHADQGHGKWLCQHETCASCACRTQAVRTEAAKKGGSGLRESLKKRLFMAVWNTVRRQCCR